MPNAISSANLPTREAVDQVRSSADALYRAAVECCRQHDRAVRLPDTEEPELEHRQADALCRMCDGSLAELSEAYSKAAAHVHPEGDLAWWHKANGLWHASREYARRHARCDASRSRESGKHAAQQLADLQMDYELEASALLALRHAADAYQKTRPGLS